MRAKPEMKPWGRTKAKEDELRRSGTFGASICRGCMHEFETRPSKSATKQKELLQKRVSQQLSLNTDEMRRTE